MFTKTIMYSSAVFPNVNIAAQLTVGWALLAVKNKISMNCLATFHKVGPGRGEHDGEKSFRIGSLICRAVRARSYALLR